MKILKIIAGIILLIFSFILAMAAIMSFLNSLPQIKNEFAKSTSIGIAYLSGSLVVVVAAFFLCYCSTKKGVKLIKPKAVPVESTDDIGL